ncbi:outer membrane lipoprotein G [Salmonella enterica subsp. arizonae]|uniref:Outer membrane lipoprotein G n=1 Tax=Salmonella enterica subsp. arizonae TaxID=59203 RepID=A0A2X4TCF0_SALER|nr:outer membrane lipoprotein G [Salmonella enterica subsp. arizonae]
MKTLLSSTALIMCAGMACAQAAENNDWHFNIGAMYEIENVESQSEDMDGLGEPSIYFNASNGPGVLRWPIIRKVRLIIALETAALGLIVRNWKCVTSSLKAPILTSD